MAPPSPIRSAGGDPAFLPRRGEIPEYRELRIWAPTLLRELDTGVDGHAVFRDLSPGLHAVEVRGHRERIWIVRVRDGADGLAIDLAEPAAVARTLRGRVVLRDGTGAEGMVHLWGPRGAQASAVPRGGEFAIRWFGDGGDRLKVELHDEARRGRLFDFPLPPTGEDAELVVE